MDRHVQRTRKLNRSLFTSILAKVISLPVQFWALPIAAGTLGIQKFGVYAMIVAIFSFANIFSTLIGSSLAMLVVEAASNNDSNLEARLFSTAFFSSLILACFIAILGVTLILTFNLSSLLGSASVRYLNSVDLITLYVSLILAVQVVLNLGESAQAGYQRYYYNNVFNSLSNIVVVVAIILSMKAPSIMSLFLSVYLPPCFFKVINLFFLWRISPNTYPRISCCDLHILSKLFKFGKKFAVIQLCSLAYLQYPIVLLGIYYGPESSAILSIMMQLVALSGSLLILVTQPLLPAIRDAALRNHFSWIGSIYTKTILLSVLLMLLSFTSIILFGDLIASFILRHQFTSSVLTRLLWALFLVIVGWEHICYTYMIGIGKIKQATFLYSIGAFFMLISLHIMIPYYAINGVLFSLCLGPLLFTAAPFHIIIKKVVCNRQCIAQQ